MRRGFALKRPGYEVDVDRVIAQARKNDCFLEINSSPDRLDPSAENARKAKAVGAHRHNTDAHGTGELPPSSGVESTRRAGRALKKLPF